MMMTKRELQWEPDFGIVFFCNTVISPLIVVFVILRRKREPENVSS